MSARVLIVDDEDDTLFVFSRLVSRLNLDVDTARSLEDAHQAISENDYRVIVTDLRLTAVTGEEGLHVLRSAHEKNGNTAVIVVTGYGSPAVMTKTYELGAAYYFEKPVRPAQLLNALEALCR